jgi:hypothetical protein
LRRSPDADSDDLTAAVSRLSFSGDDFPSHSGDIEFIARHFDEMTLDLFKSISLNLADAILSDPGLVVKSEDDLYAMVSSRFEDDDSFCELLAHIQFEYLSVSAIGQFVQNVPFDSLNARIWERIGLRLRLPVSSGRNSRVRDAGAPPQLHLDADFSGIIAGLTSECGGNVHDKGIVTVSASSIREGAPSNVVDFSNENGLSTRHTRAPWIMFDFKDRMVKLNEISLLLANRNPTFGCADRFFLEVSRDGSNWSPGARFTVGGASDERVFYRGPVPPGLPESRWVRLRVDSSTLLQLSVISCEFFGSVRLAPSPPDVVPVLPGRGTTAVPGDGQPLPREFRGIAHFLNEQAEANVEVSWARPSEVRTGTLSGAIVSGSLSRTYARWIQLRFPNHRIRVTHWALFLSHTIDLRWLLSCSDDGEQWTEVDQRSVSRSRMTFALATPIECSWVRIAFPPRLLAPSGVNGFDVFGTILN